MTGPSTSLPNSATAADEPEFASYAELADEADHYCVELRGWLDTFSSGPKKWPDHNIANKRRRLAWAEKIAELCRRAAQRQGEAA